MAAGRSSTTVPAMRMPPARCWSRFTKREFSPGSPAYQRGVRYLLDTQLADGSWRVRTRTLPTQIHFESGFPHGEHQFISAAGTHWATQALAWSVVKLRAWDGNSGSIAAAPSRTSWRAAPTASCSRTSCCPTSADATTTRRPGHPRHARPARRRAAADRAHRRRCKMGTTVATNALLERKGERTVLVDHARLRRPAAHRLSAPARLFVRAHRAADDALRGGDRDRRAHRRAGRGARARSTTRRAPESRCAVACASGIARLRHRAHARLPLSRARARARRAWPREVGFTQVSVRHRVSPLIRLVARGDTTVADAYLSPVLRGYVDARRDALPGTRLQFMQSNGRPERRRSFHGKDAILSGPAGGIVGAARAARRPASARSSRFDMGGTSTDVGALRRRIRARARRRSRRRAGAHAHAAHPHRGRRRRLDLQFRRRAACASGRIPPAPIPGPASVSARRAADGDRLQRVAGPHPAGLLPGACSARTAIAARRARWSNAPVRRAGRTDRTRDRHAPDAVRRWPLVASASRSRTWRNAIKKISVQRGHDVTDYALVCFGGAGGQHACLVADALGMRPVVIHPLAGVLSAYGIGLADIRSSCAQQAVERAARRGIAARCARPFDALGRAGARGAGAAGRPGDDPRRAQRPLKYADTRLDARRHRRRQPRRHGRGLPRASTGAASASHGGPGAGDRNRHGRASSARATPPIVVEVPAGVQRKRARRARAHVDAAECVSTARGSTRRSSRDALRPGDAIAGPAVISERNTTVVVERGWRADVDRRGPSRARTSGRRRAARTSVDHAPIRCCSEIFNNLFMAIAEQMGVDTGRTPRIRSTSRSGSTSPARCSTAHGQLIANAPHMPVHLGSMGESRAARSCAARRDHARRATRSR